jgi:dienelactone hydrolase
MKFIVALFFIASLVGQSSESNFIGCWLGNINALGNKIAIKTCFAFDSNGKVIGNIDIPQQNAFNLNLSNIRIENDSCHFDLIINSMNIAKFSGMLKYSETDSAKIIGEFRQMGVVGDFELGIYFEEKTIQQDSIPEFYEEEVVVRNGEIELAGTFSRPFENKPYTTIIFVTGSGPQNRDEEVFGFKIFKAISDELVSYGFATIRTDDRGVGGSKEKTEGSSTTFDVASDILAIKNFLKSRSDVDTNRIGILGHSEGALAAFIASTNSSDFAFIVSLAGPIVRGDSLIVEQIRIQMKNEGIPDSLIEETISDQYLMYNIMRENKDIELARNIMRRRARKQLELYPEEVRTQITDKLIERNIQIQLESMRSDWFRKFIDIDPLDYIKKVQCPILFVFGGKDQQVPSEIMLARLNPIAKNKPFAIEVFPDANHLFQKAKTGKVIEYGILPKKFTEGFLEFLVKWLKEINK